MALSRRTLLRNGWKFGGSLLAVAGGWTVFESLRPLATGSSTGVMKVGNASDYAKDTSTYIPAGRMYITNAGGEIFALSQKCPHLGCRVPFCDSSGRFECACHGSVYDLAGEYLKGPAPRGMDRFPVAAKGEALLVDTTKLITGPAKGATAHLTAPKGPSCTEGG